MSEFTTQLMSAARAAGYLRPRNAMTIWPNDCPECGARMEFAFTTPEADNPGAHRRCPAGHTITAQQCLPA